MLDFTHPRRLVATLLVAARCLTGTLPTQAQASFSVGPQVSLGAAFSPYAAGDYLSRPYQTRYRIGFEAGVAGSIGFGHVVVQPALLFAQRGFRIDDDFVDYYNHDVTKASLRLNYLTLPVSVAYALRPNGQGLQVFAGPYVSLLLGGQYAFDNTYVGYRRPQYTVQGTLPVAGSGSYHYATLDPNAAPNVTTYYSRRMDAGFQAGGGYRAGQCLFRLSFSMGLLNTGVGEMTDHGGTAGVYIVKPSTYYNRALLASFTYLLGPKD